jgi:hypothetical protein
MALRYWTLIVMAVALVGVIAYDSYVNWADSDATISHITAQWAIRHSFSVWCVAFALGVVVGHLFWWQSPKP